MTKIDLILTFVESNQVGKIFETVLFLRQVYYLFIYAPKTKNSTEKKNSHRLQC